MTSSRPAAGAAVVARQAQTPLGQSNWGNRPTKSSLPLGLWMMLVIAANWLGQTSTASRGLASGTSLPPAPR